jgi:uncharacterized RmlC-like cupin family protein
VTVRKIAAEQRAEGDPTAGMIREEAIVTDRLWAGLVRTAPGATSGWHHHGDHDTSIYVLRGALKLEFGPNGDDVVDGGPDDFVLIGPNTVHRESNPSGEESHLIVVRAGEGPPTVNVDGPA